MICYLIVGAPRQGKSNYAKALITQPNTINKPCYVLDPRNEYGATYKTLINNNVTTVPGVGLPANQPQLKRSRYVGDRNGINVDYFNAIVNQKSGSFIVYDESTGILKGQLSKALNDMLTGRFHSSNSFIFVFHSLETIPPDIIRNSSCNKIILFNTLDNVKSVNAKFSNHYLNEGLRLQNMKPNKSAPTEIDILEGKINGKDFDRQAVKTLF